LHLRHSFAAITLLVVSHDNSPARKALPCCEGTTDVEFKKYLVLSVVIAFFFVCNISSLWGFATKLSQINAQIGIN
jgi:hypothetical protein